MKKPCYVCGKSLSLKMFHPSALKRFDYRCKTCALAYQARIAVIPAVRERRRRSMKRFNLGRKRVVRELKESQPCTDCSKKYPYYVMEYDHLDPTSKINNVSTMAQLDPDNVMEEIAKCDLVCANCHRERSHRRQHKVA